MVFRGLTMPRQNREFRQDKTFWYLTGVDSRDAALVGDIDEGTEIAIDQLPDYQQGRVESGISAASRAEAPCNIERTRGPRTGSAPTDGAWDHLSVQLRTECADVFR